MMKKLSYTIALFLCRKSNYNDYENDLPEVVSYGIESLISLTTSIAIVVLCGVFAKNLSSAIIYYVSFIILRFVYGGYHAETNLKCKLIFIIVTLSVLVFVSLSRYYSFLCEFVLLVVSDFSLIVMKPEITKENIDIQKLRKLSIILTLTFSFLSVVLFNIVKKISLAISLSIAVVSISLLVTKFERR